MDKGNFVSSDKKLEQALGLVRADRAEAEKFAANPEAYLKSKGVSTDALKFGAGAELSEAQLETVAGGVAQSISVCGSVGCIACATVGGGDAY